MGNELASSYHRSRSLFSFIKLPNTRTPISYVIFLVGVAFVIGYLSASNTLKKLSILEKNIDHNRFDMIRRCGKPVLAEDVRSTVLYAFFDGVSPYKDFPPPQLAPLLKTKRLEGWGSSDDVFSHLMKKVRPRTIIEIGSFLGASATHMAELARDLGVNAQILCVDDFRGWAGFRDSFPGFPIQNANVMLLAQFMQNVVTMEFTESILPLPFSSSSTLDKLCELGISGDLVEIDAAHDFHSAWDDINRAYKVLKPGGVMFGHDYFNEQDDFGVKRAVDLFCKVNGFKITTDGGHWILDVYG